jgi:hypothetical protein
MNQTLLVLLDKEEWKLGLAAWIFAGYSPLEKQRTGTIVRIADEESFAFGSFEYREAEKAKQAIQDQLTERVIDSKGLNETHNSPFFDNQRFDRNWLIDIAANSYDIGTPRNLDVWWLTKAVKEHYVPAYVCSKAISDSDRKARGSLSWRLPTKPDDIKDPKAYGTEGFGEGPFGTSTGQVKHVTALFKPSNVRPNENIEPWVKGVPPKRDLYPFFYKVIAAQISVVPEKQAEIEGVEKHGCTRPTAAVGRDLIVEAAKQELEDFQVRKAKYGGDLEWLSRVGSKYEEDADAWDVCHTITMLALADRIKDWFNKTDAGLSYDDWFNLNTTKFEKKDKSS